MMGLERAMFGERPDTEVVVESVSDDPDRDGSRFDPDDPGASTLRLAPNPHRDGAGRRAAGPTPSLRPWSSPSTPRSPC